MPGRLNRDGYTLIELVAVMALLGIFLVLSVPRLKETLLSNDLKACVIRLSSRIEQMRTEAVRRHTDFFLNMDVDAESYRVTSSDMTGQAKAEAVSTQLEDGLAITDVEFLNGKVASGVAVIGFSKKGYATAALIHLADNRGSVYTLFVRSFLPKVRLADRYEGFPDESM